MSKVTVPNDVAKALKTMQREISSNIKIIDIVTNPDEYGIVIENKELGNTPYTLRAYTMDNSEKFLSALVNGYEVERTKEDKVREYYNELGNNVDGFGVLSVREQEKQNSVLKTLELLDIQIPGVNDK